MSIKGQLLRLGIDMTKSNVIKLGGLDNQNDPLAFANAQTIDMADAQVVLTMVPGTPTGTLITSNVLYVDPNQAVATSEDLLLPPEADCNGLFLLIANTAGAAESIIVKEDGDSTTIGTIAQNEVGYFFCNGTTWRGGVSTNT